VDPVVERRWHGPSLYAEGDRLRLCLFGTVVSRYAPGYARRAQSDTSGTDGSRNHAGLAQPCGRLWPREESNLRTRIRSLSAEISICSEKPIDVKAARQCVRHSRVAW
jgi:hypothetical protein